LYLLSKTKNKCISLNSGKDPEINPIAIGSE
jgi:hypothetical protein